jgi:hypothetical protein
MTKVDQQHFIKTFRKNCEQQWLTIANQQSISLRSTVNGQRSTVIGQRSTVIGHRSTVIGPRHPPPFLTTEKTLTPIGIKKNSRQYDRASSEKLLHHLLKDS